MTGEKEQEFGFSEGGHNSGEHVAQSDIEQQSALTGWQGGSEATADEDADPEEPAIQ